jgi:hypothetical protein
MTFGWVNNPGSANVLNVLKGSKYVKMGYSFVGGSAAIHTHIFDIDTIALFNTLGDVISDSLATITTEPDSIQRIGNLISLRDGDGSVDLSDLVNVADSTNIVDGWGITAVESPTNTYNLIADSSQVFTQYDGTLKQDELVSGTNIKTVNGNSLLGSGNVVVSGADSTIVQNGYGTIITESPSNTFNVTVDSSKFFTNYKGTLKQDLLTGANKRIPYFTSTSTLGNSDNLVFDNATKYLGIGTASPDATIHMTQATGNRIRFTDPSAGTNYKNWQIFAGSGGDERNLSFQSLSDAGTEYNFMTWRKGPSSQVVSNLYIPHLATSSGTEVTTVNTVGEIYRSELKTVGGTSLFGSGNITTENPLTFSSPLSRSGNTISIPAASTSVSGHLTSTDWNTFNSKVGGSGTVNYIPKWSAINTISNNSLIYDNGINVAIGLDSYWNNYRTTNNNMLDIGGSVAIGQTYAGQFSKPNGLIVKGKVSLNVENNVLDVGMFDYYTGYQRADANNIEYYVNYEKMITYSANNFFVDYNRSAPRVSNYAGRGFEIKNAGSHYTRLVNDYYAGDSGAGGITVNGWVNKSNGLLNRDNNSLNTTGLWITRDGEMVLRYYPVGVTNPDLFTKRFEVKTSGVVNIPNLAGTGTRMVTATSGGDLGTAAILSGTGTTNTLAFWDSGTSIAASQITRSSLGLGFGVASGSITHSIDMASGNTIRLRTGANIMDRLNSGGANGYVLQATGGSGVEWVSTSGLLSEVDGSVTNEGFLGVGSSGTNQSLLQGYNSSGTSTGTGVTFQSQQSVTLTETTSTNGGTINIGLSRPYAHLRSTGFNVTQNLSANTWTKINFENIQNSSGYSANTTSEDITIGSNNTGVAECTFTSFFIFPASPNTGFFEVALFKNGSQITQSTISYLLSEAGRYWSVPISWTENFANTTDTIDVRVRSSSAMTGLTVSGANFIVQRIN